MHYRPNTPPTLIKRWWITLPLYSWNIFLISMTCVEILNLARYA